MAEYSNDFITVAIKAARLAGPPALHEEMLKEVKKVFAGIIDK